MNKNYKLLSVLSVILLIITFSSCSPKEDTNSYNKNYSDILTSTNSNISISDFVPDEYEEVLVDYKRLLDFRFSDNYWTAYENGENIQLNEKLESDLEKEIKNISGESTTLGSRWSNMVGEIDSFLEKDGTPNSFGYILKDINNDGIIELFWVDENYNILAIFTVIDGKAKLLDAFWPKHKCVITNDNELYISDTGGSAYNYYEIKILDSHSQDFISVKEFGREGWNKTTDSMFYYEVIDGEKTSIKEKRFYELLSLFPLQHENGWKELTINFFNT